MKRTARWISCVLGGSFAPVAVLALYMFRFPGAGHGSSDDKALMVSEALGLLFFSLLPISWRIKLALSPFYAVAIAMALFYFEVGFACGTNRGCM